jgi:hypothetical protein
LIPEGDAENTRQGNFQNDGAEGNEEDAQIKWKMTSEGHRKLQV